MGNRMRIITVAADCTGKIEQNSHLHGREHRWKRNMRRTASEKLIKH